jgi:hypothetical protein
MQAASRAGGVVRLMRKHVSSRQLSVTVEFYDGEWASWFAVESDPVTGSFWWGDDGGTGGSLKVRDVSAELRSWLVSVLEQQRQLVVS